MSKRCELQKEYHKEFGNYKGNGKYNDSYVNWLESKILALNIQSVSKRFYCENGGNECLTQCYDCKKDEERI